MLCCPAAQNVTEHLILQISKRMLIKNMSATKAVQIMKKPKIKYVGWCHECKCLGSFICGNCKPNEKYSFARPSEFMPKDKKRWVRMEE